MEMSTPVEQQTLAPLGDYCAYEALREKVSLLGGFQEIRLKFRILKIDFLHEKNIFFDLDFFPDKILLRSVRK